MIRGIRNNNPGNIVRSKTAWAGKVPHDIATDKRFEQFQTMAYGIVALIRLLSAYYNKRKLRTIRQIMNRYAPAFENDTTGYINTLARQTGVGPDVVFPWRKDTVRTLIAGIIKKETAYDMSASEWDEAWQIAYPPQKKSTPIKLLETPQDSTLFIMARL